MKRKKLVTLIGSVCLILVLAALPFLTACPAPAEEGEILPPAEEEEEEPIEVIELKLSYWGAGGTALSRWMEEAPEIILERTGGRVVVTNYMGGSLLAYPDSYTGVSRGLADIGRFTFGTAPGVHVLSYVSALPFMGFPGMEATGNIYNELRSQFPELDKEFTDTGTRWLAARAMPPYQLHLVNKPARVPEDISGMKVISSEELKSVCEGAGAALVSVAPGDMYMALDRGLAEAQFLHWPFLGIYKTLELFNHHTQFGTAGCQYVMLGFVINLDTWNSLPPDIQKVLVEVYQWVCDEEDKFDLGYMEQTKINAREMGHTFTYLTPAEIQLWADLAQPYHERWIADCVAAGYSEERVREIYEEAKRLAEAYR